MKLSGRFKQNITMYIRTGDTYGADGRPVPGAETSETVSAVVQRLSMRDRELLPEGFRSTETYKLYLETDDIQLIESGENIDAAEFEIKGKRYSMIASEEWDKLIPHWKITVARK